MPLDRLDFSLNAVVRRLRDAAIVGVSLTALILAGCGDDRGVVTGQVTLDGQPLAGGSGIRALVLFYPTEKAGSPATGSLDANGRYSLAIGSQGSVVPGTYVVTVSATQLIPSPNLGEAPSGRAITPRHYSDPKQSEWKVEVKPGNNTFDFQLKSDS
jgi:hypothetical protein